MHNPTHPGEVLRDWLPEQITVTQAAKELQVSRVTLSKCVKILFRSRKLI
jgi:plasmid maintenance system antidote protein VapI